MQSEPVLGCAWIFLGTQIKLFPICTKVRVTPLSPCPCLCIPQLFLFSLVRVEDQRSKGSHGVHQTIPVLHGMDTTGHILEHSRIIEVVVYRLIVSVNFKVTVGILHPHHHFAMKDFQVIQHGLTGPNGRSGAEHGFIVMDVLAVAKGPVHQPVGRSNRVMLLKDLEALYDGSFWPEGISLKEGIPHVGDEDGSPTRFGRIGLSPTIF
mmetsp:Transcript_8929/g.12707  ORF Transcript_8929/g.12707 Transcript_8929/m.12707 type:complete len:208 (-) Transcript_8929:769-1392(-)